MTEHSCNTPHKSRGAISNPEGRFEPHSTERIDDGWGSLEEDLPPLKTTLHAETARSIISRNNSPDIPFEQSINPYRGCEHGCVYCYARPSHAYLNLSPGLDFETRLFFKPNAAARLQLELSRKNYRPNPITLGANTDPYQPVEQRERITRSILEVLQAHRHPLTIITKSTLIERDMDILGEMARNNLTAVMISITSLDNGIKRTLEPRAASPAGRLRTLARLREAGIPTGILMAPIIPAVNDAEIEAVLERAVVAGALTAGYTLLRLPFEVKDLFEEWLREHLPLRAEHVMNLIRETRGGKRNQSGFGTRMRGTGRYAELIAQRFKLARKKLGLDQRERLALDTSLFRVPGTVDPQMGLWD